MENKGVEPVTTVSGLILVWILNEKPLEGFAYREDMY